MAGLTALLLAAEYARQAEAGLDTTLQTPASMLERLHLPVAEVRPPDPGPLALPDLVRAAVHGHRAAHDEVLRLLGRAGAEAIPARLGHRDLDASASRRGPAPGLGPGAVGCRDDASRPGRPVCRGATSRPAGLGLRPRPSLPDERVVRASEVSRLQSRGLGLTAADIEAAAAASFPRGTARAYADLLAEASKGELLSAGVSRRVLESLRDAGAARCLGERGRTRSGGSRRGSGGSPARGRTAPRRPPRRPGGPGRACTGSGRAGRPLGRRAGAGHADGPAVNSWVGPNGQENDAVGTVESRPLPGRPSSHHLTPR